MAAVDDAQLLEAMSTATTSRAAASGPPRVVVSGTFMVEANPAQLQAPKVFFWYNDIGIVGITAML
jgi:hypothetical protein